MSKIPAHILVSLGRGSMIDNFFQLATSSAITEQLRQFAVEQDNLDQYTVPISSQSRKYILQTQVPKTLLSNCPVLSKLLDNFTWFSALIFKMDPFSLYDWHVDSKDQAPAIPGKTFSINLLLQNQRSSLLVANESPDTRTRFTEFQYEPNRLYLLRSNIPHAIVNFEQTRYLLSIRVTSPTYEQAVDYCQSNNL